MARVSCLMLFWHFMRAAASRTFCTAGSNSPIRTAMMAMTTSSSMSVNAERETRCDIVRPSRRINDGDESNHTCGITEYNRNLKRLFHVLNGSHLQGYFPD